MLFISPQNLVSFSRYLSFCLDFLVMYKNSLIRKMRLISKFISSQTWLANNCNTHVAQYLRGKGNQTMTFGQLIEFNMRNIFVEKSYTKCDGEIIPRPFYTTSKLSICLGQ